MYLLGDRSEMTMEQELFEADRRVRSTTALVELPLLMRGAEYLY